MEYENERAYLSYFFKKTVFGMVLHVRVTPKEEPRNSSVFKCSEEQTVTFIRHVEKSK